MDQATPTLQLEPFTAAIARYGYLRHIIRGTHPQPAREYEALCGFSPTPAIKRSGRQLTRDGRWYAEGHFENLEDFTNAHLALRNYCGSCLDILRGERPMPPRRIPLEIAPNSPAPDQS